jgi:hypothetical protein
MKYFLLAALLLNSLVCITPGLASTASFKDVIDESLDKDFHEKLSVSSGSLPTKFPEEGNITVEDLRQFFTLMFPQPILKKACSGLKAKKEVQLLTPKGTMPTLHETGSVYELFSHKTTSHQGFVIDGTLQKEIIFEERSRAIDGWRNQIITYFITPKASEGFTATLTVIKQFKPESYFLEDGSTLAFPSSSVPPRKKSSPSALVLGAEMEPQVSDKNKTESPQRQRSKTTGAKSSPFLQEIKVQKKETPVGSIHDKYSPQFLRTLTELNKTQKQ